jgi:hypothetical protein
MATGSDFKTERSGVLHTRPEERGCRTPMLKMHHQLNNQEAGTFPKQIISDQSAFQTLSDKELDPVSGAVGSTLRQAVSRLRQPLSKAASHSAHTVSTAVLASVGADAYKAGKVTAGSLTKAGSMKKS